MKRRKFIGLALIISGAAATQPLAGFTLSSIKNRLSSETTSGELIADVVIAGGGLGGCAAALSTLRNGLNVILTEETDWIGGQMTSQGVPPDEHRWIETHGATSTYRELGLKRTGNFKSIFNVYFDH